MRSSISARICSAAAGGGAGAATFGAFAGARPFTKLDARIREAVRAMLDTGAERRVDPSFQLGQALTRVRLRAQRTAVQPERASHRIAGKPAVRRPLCAGFKRLREQRGCTPPVTHVVARLAPENIVSFSVHDARQRRVRHNLVHDFDCAQRELPVSSLGGELWVVSPLRFARFSHARHECLGDARRHVPERAFEARCARLDRQPSEQHVAEIDLARRSLFADPQATPGEYVAHLQPFVDLHAFDLEHREPAIQERVEHTALEFGQLQTTVSEQVER
jgi:hypothetical protein